VTRGRSLGPLAALVVAATASLVWLLPDFYEASLSTGDGAVYLVCARSLLAGEGYSYLGDPFSIRPPGFSVLVAPVIAVFGMDYRALTWFVGLFAVLSVALLFLYQRPRLGAPVAFAVAVAVWLNPGFLQSTGQIMSDVPGLAALFACLVVERWARRRKELWPDVLLGLLIGVSAYVRSISIFMVPALVLARLCGALLPAADDGGRGGLSLPAFALRRLAVPALLPFLLLLPWNLRNAAVADRISPDHTLFQSYSVAMWHQDISDPSSPRITFDQFVERVQERSRDLLGVLGSRMASREPSPASRAIAIGALLCWAFVLAKRRGTGDFLTGGITLIIACYFGFMNRLVLPVYVLVLPAVAQVLLWVLARPLGARRAGWTVAGLVLALGLHDHRAHWDADPKQKRSEEFFQACRAAARHFPEDEPLASDFGAHFSVELDRPVYTLRWTLKRGGVPDALRFIDERGIRGVICDISIANNVALANRLATRGRRVEQVGPYALMRVE
jgi:4-amino-4-deoxy-L-arabinose transferase-like glycosyltransferase